MTSPQPSGKALHRRFRWQCRCIFWGRARRLQTLGLLVLWALLLPMLLAAQEPGGRFLSVQGEVQVFRGSQTLPATVKLALQPGDVIRTGPGARAAILLTDGAQLKLAANSTLQLKQVSPRRPGRVTPAAVGGVRTILQFFLGEGWLRSTAPADELEVETPSATAATKGIEFTLAVGADGAAVFTALDGFVQAANPQGAVLIAQGEPELRSVSITWSAGGKPVTIRLAVIGPGRLGVTTEGSLAPVRLLVAPAQTRAHLIAHKLPDLGRDTLFRETLGVARTMAEALLR